MNDPKRSILSAREAYALCARSSRLDLRRALEARETDPAAFAIVKASIAALDGDTLIADAIFARALASLEKDASYAYVVDSYVPMLISRLDYARALEILEHDLPEPLYASYASLRAMAFAQSGDTKAARRWYGVAAEQSARCDDEIVRVKIEMRAALTAFYLGVFDEAVVRAENAVRRGAETGAFTVCAHGTALIVNVCFGVYGDAERARAYASREADFAMRAQDGSAMVNALSNQLEIAAASGDLRGMQALRREIGATTMGPRSRQRMSVVLGEILAYAWSGNFAAASARSEVMRGGDCSRIEAMLCTAFIALAAYACNLRGDALAAADEVFGCDARTVAAERHFACMSRIIAAHVEIACGRRYAGQRRLRASSVRGVPEAGLAELVAAGSVSENAAPRWLTGYARALCSADSSAASRSIRAELTRAEHDVLALLAEGQSAKLVAAQLGLRTATVRTHAAAIARILGTHTIVEAIAEARRRGIL